MTPHAGHPPPECPLCLGTLWWRHRAPGIPWICGRCVEPVLEPGELEWREPHPAPEVRP